MAWIEAHQSLLRHRKTLAASQALGVDRHKLIGHLFALWWWAVDNVPGSGELDGIAPDTLAAAAEWPPSKGDAFVRALLSAGFIDDRGGVLALHDWPSYGGRAAVSREQTRERQKRYRERNASRDVAGTSPSRPANGPVTAGDAYNNTEQNITPLSPRNAERYDDDDGGAFRERLGTYELAIGTITNARVADELRDLAERYTDPAAPGRAITEHRKRFPGKRIWPSKLAEILDELYPRPSGKPSDDLAEFAQSIIRGDLAATT